MWRVFEKALILPGLLLAVLPVTAIADTATSPLCQPLDEKATAAAVDAYFAANLREHAANSFSRTLRDTSRAQAKAYLTQRVADKRAELCASRLKLAQDIKAAGASSASGTCSAARVVSLLDAYASAAAAANDQNRQALGSMLDAHLRQIKLKLFEIARGSNAGVDGATGSALASAPKETRYEWVKQEASKLGAEANTVWGASNSAANPLVLASLPISQEAGRARQERDAAKARYHSDGRMPASCAR